MLKRILRWFCREDEGRRWVDADGIEWLLVDTKPSTAYDATNAYSTTNEVP